MKKTINKKSILTVLLAVMLMLSVVACGSKKEDTAKEKETEAKKETEEKTEKETEEKTEKEAETEKSADATTGKALEDGVLDLGTNAAFPPYEFYEGEKIVGIDPEIAQAVADHLGYKLKIHDMEFANIIASIESGKVDGGIAGMTVTEERLESVNFSNSYATGIQSIIVTLDSDIEGPDDLAGKKIGTQFGTTGDFYAQDDFGEDNVQSFDKGADAVVALNAGKVDAVIIDNEPAKSFAAANDNLKVLETNYAVEDYAIALTKTNDALLTEVNEALTALRENGKLQEIIDKYIKAE
ncbi:MAG TPA: transporter substrate-binding domain-containing protein [Clostridiaceae bacterium]|nr:transporter substrate-binding domain-containing protein [Clostridiaceae bacterium]